MNMNSRFKMSFVNTGTVPASVYNNYVAVNIAQRLPKPAPLNAPMIDRVHKAKAGCSACGKKVA